MGVLKDSKIDKIYEAKFSNYIKHIDDQFANKLAEFDLEYILPGYDVSSENMLMCFKEGTSLLKNRIKRAIKEKDKVFLKELAKGGISLPIIKPSGIKDDSFILTKRIFGDTVKINEKASIIFPDNLYDKIDYSGYLHHRDSFEDALNKVFNTAIGKHNALYAFTGENGQFTKSELALSFNYTLEKILDVFEEQLANELSASQDDYSRVTRKFPLETFLSGLSRGSYLSMIFDSKEEMRQNEELKRLKIFCEKSFDAFIDKDISPRILYNTTAYVDSAAPYAKLFHFIGNLSLEDFEKAQKYRDAAYELKGDFRGGGEPDPAIKEELKKMRR